MMNYQYLDNSDFRKASPKCSIKDMDAVFLHRLDVARFHAEVPFIVTSAYRTVDHEKSKGRDGLSSHTKGIAVDLKAANSRTRSRIICGLIKAGFTRIGISNKQGFIHVDLDHEKDENVIWLY